MNEARLTALALSAFLAAVSLTDADPANPDPLRLLVLDDVLIGLDLNNRLPLLELLRTRFIFAHTRRGRNGPANRAGFPPFPCALQEVIRTQCG